MYCRSGWHSERSSGPVTTPSTPGSASASLGSMFRIRACAYGLVTTAT